MNAFSGHSVRSLAVTQCGGRLRRLSDQTGFRDLPADLPQMKETHDG
jgi:hypothetical protein